MTTTSTHETEITVDPDVPLVRITREFDAPREKVFRAHTDPELVVQWLGPRSMEMTVDHYDCRTGGSYRYVHSLTVRLVRGTRCLRGERHGVWRPRGLRALGRAARLTGNRAT